MTVTISDDVISKFFGEEAKDLNQLKSSILNLEGVDFVIIHNRRVVKDMHKHVSD